jgi:hypothetical protein
LPGKLFQQQLVLKFAVLLTEPVRYSAGIILLSNSRNGFRDLTPILKKEFQALNNKTIFVARSLPIGLAVHGGNTTSQIKFFLDCPVI